MLKKSKNPQLKDFRLLPHTAGAILGGIWIKEDGSELKIKIAWKDGFLHFKPLKRNEEDL